MHSSDEIKEGQNTLIGYMYRDAANYKFYYEEVVAGAITEDQIGTILNCLDCGIYFIPGQVGLPCEYARNCDYDEQLDHPWCELREDGFELVNDEPTLNMTVNTLVQSFLNASGRWEE